MRAVSMVAVDPYFDALHLGGLLAVLAGSAVLYWLVSLLYSRRAGSLTASLSAVLLGAMAVSAGYFLPWARVEGHRVSVTLFGGDFGGAFGAGVLCAIGVAVFLAAALSPLWKSSTLRVGLGAVTLGGGVGAGLLGVQFLRPDQSQILAAFSQHGASALAETRHIPLSQAQEVVDRLIAGGALHAAHSFGPYVVVGGAVLVTAAAVLNFLHQARGAFAGLGRRGQPVGRSAEGGPLARGRSTGRQVPAPQPSMARRPAQRAAEPARSEPGSAPAGPVSAHEVVVDSLPPAPPMPVGSGPSGGQGRAHLDPKWAASPDTSRRSRRARAR